MPKAKKQSSGKLEPVVAQYPKCSACNKPFVLKLVMVMHRNYGGTGKTQCYMDFMWARDCKHKKADAIIVDHRLPDSPTSKPKAKRGKKE